jgi:hypothetical protein
MRLFLVLSLLLAPISPTPGPTARATVPEPSAAPLSADVLFSRRALRRAKLLIQMRVMEFHEERLECIREALRRQLPGALWPEEPAPSRGTSGLRQAAERCEEMLKF